MVGLLDPAKYGEYFYDLYTSNTRRKLQNDRQLLAKRKSKDKKAAAMAAAAAVLEVNAGAIVNPMDPPIVKDQLLLFPAFPVAHIELDANGSKFALFSAIRSTVLEAETRYALFQDSNYGKKIPNFGSACCLVCAGTCMLSNLVECSCHTVLSMGALEKHPRHDSANSDGDSESEEVTEKEAIILRVPFIVGAGLRSLFELIADARDLQPMLCTKALKALLDVIQGQQPESFKLEPDDLMNPLYDLLLDLATMPAAAMAHTAHESNWSAMACAALLGLCIARGDTGKILKAIAALLMSPKQLSKQIIQLPSVLSTLQQTVMSAALNKPTRPDFHTHGVPTNSLIDEFILKSTAVATNFVTQPAMASDGTYIYLLLGSSLLKIGSGFSGSYKGHIYLQNDDFSKEKSGWLGYCAGQLYYRRHTKRNTDHLYLVNTETLMIKGTITVNMLPIREGCNYVLFTDEDSLNAICTNRDDSLVVKKLNINHTHYNGEPQSYELPLQLARRKFRTLGYAAFEDEVLNQNQVQKIQSSYNTFDPKLPNDHEVQGIACGKEFGLVRASNGKVFYYGKSSSLGLKSSGRTPTMKLTELIISKVSNIVHLAVGHDGIHALLVNDDGTVYFTGTARRGEDGDSSKNRRQPKAVKPKKMSKIDGHVIVQAACNNGTSAFVTKAGKLIMFGKDTVHCDSTGFVSDFLDQHITKVALGKAHCVALNSKGQLFTFGLNNKGQCGRSFGKSKDVYAVGVSSGNTDVDGKGVKMGKKLKFDFSNLCDYDEHNLVQGQCRVCVVCRECTGYNVSCVSALNVPVEERMPGAICPCGHGEAGCSKCGLCSTCVSVQETENDTKDPKPLHTELNRQRSKSLLLRRREKKVNEENNIASELDKDPPRVAPLAPQLLPLPTNSPVVQVACGLHHTVVLTLAGEVFTFGSNQYGQLGSGDLQPVNGPVRVSAQGAISQVAAGSNHTILMTSKGMVYSFGSYQKGQLGRMPNDFQQKASFIEEVGGKNADQNAASGSKDITIANILTQRQKFLWHCAPGAVFGLGPSFGKKATWIGASGDQTFIKIDESLITTQMLPKVNVVANKKTILLIPNIPLTFHSLSINRRDGSCTAHYRNQVKFSEIIQNKKVNALPEINQNIATNMPQTGMPSAGPINEQMSRSMHEARNQIFDLQDNRLSGEQQRRHQRKPEHAKSPAGGVPASDKSQPQIAFALDPYYNVLWLYDSGGRRMQCFNVLASEIPENGLNAGNYRAILSPELSLPNKCDFRVSRSQASLNLLACLDVLTSAQDSIPGCFEEILPKQQKEATEAQNNEYQIVNRFDNFGGGWGYSGHSVEAIRFSADTDLMICGFGMFGGRGEYTCKVKLYDMGSDGGGYEKEGVLICETKEVPFECAARSQHHIMLPKPINALAGRWYLVWARIAGPSSDCGSCGQATVTTEDQIVFSFKSSKKANNGTDVNSGQIPSVLYRLITQESKQPPAPVDLDPVQRISKAFANSVTKECFESLVLLLNWSWETFKANLREQRDKTKQLQVKQSLEYLTYVNKSCLRLLRKYTIEIYPPRTILSLLNNPPSPTIPVVANKVPPKPTKSNDKDKNAKAAGSNSASTVITNAVTKYCTEGVSNNAPTTPVVRKPNMENIQLAECIGNVRALLIGMFCDDIFKEISSDEGYIMALEILRECHISFVACFDAFYPTSSLKWNCLCDLLAQMDKGTLHSRLLSAILAGLCAPNVKLRCTFSLMNPGNERQSIISPSDNSGLPMLSSTEAHQYPILVEQMIYRTQQEKSDFLSNSWTFKDVLVRLLDIIANPIRGKIENIYNRSIHYNYASSFGSKDINQGLIDNCSHLLARVLAEIVYQTSLGEYDKMLLPPRSLQSTGSRFARCDLSRTWNTGNFGPDAIAFSVDRPGIAIAGAMVYSGSGGYDYQLELLYDNTVDLQSQHKWETLESISGSYDQETVHNDMTEIKFERPVHIKENFRYALRLCSQGARTCSGDAGMPSLRGPCGTTFHFYSCDLSFNGTTPQRGQIPCILYYSTPIKNDGSTSFVSGFGTTFSNEVTTRDTALQIATDITKKCTELLILARNALAASLSPSDNSSNHTQTIDSEHNITPIEEHMDINWANNSRTAALPVDPNLSTARDITKRFESFSKGIIETLKFDKRSTNPFEMEIEIGATEIHPKDLMIEESAGIHDLNFRNGDIAKLNGNERVDEEIAEELGNLQHNQNVLGRSDSEEVPVQLTVVQILEVFNLATSNMFHTLLPLVYAHIANLACTDPKSAVQILSLIKDILPHIAALNQLYVTKDQAGITQRLKNAAVGAEHREIEANNKAENDGDKSAADLCTTSNHYSVVESEHPYRSASISCYRVEFPPCVQWLTVEFDPQCGTAQLEDYLLVLVPMRPHIVEPCNTNEDYFDMLDNNISMQRAGSRNGAVLTSCHKVNTTEGQETVDKDWIVVKKFNTGSNWMQNVMILPGNCVEFSLETSSLYAQDPHINKYGFKCLVVGYDNPVAINSANSCLIRLEQELAYLGGMCSAYLMKQDLNLPADDKDIYDLNGVEETINAHHILLSKGFALSEPILTVQQALESYLPIGSQSNERQFLKDFISGAPGSSGGRLASWLQPESRLDPNKCELNTITEPLRYGWPTQVTVTIRDQYGDAVLVPELKVEIKAIPTGSGASGNGNIKMRRVSGTENNSFGGVAPPPRVNYEPTIKEKMCFKAITFMKPYNNYSFEELRFSSPVQTRVTETLYAQDMEDGTFSVHWTPNSIGSYCLTVTIDGILLEEVYRVEVKEGGLPPPSHRHTIKKPQPPNKLRKFYAKNTAGLRIRSHPTLQSEQVGIVKLNGVISFIDEIDNDDGVWLRLSTESIRQHCTMGWYPTEAWCLQFNQHLGKTLLFPVTDASTGAACDGNDSGTGTGSGGGGSKSVSKPRHKALLDNIDSPALPAAIDSPGKPKSASPSKKIFDFTQSRSTPSKSADAQQTTTNPFLFPNTEKSEDEPALDLQSSSSSLESQAQMQQSQPQAQGDVLLQSLQGTSPSNIGSAIAGVVGGGASKLQALQKWFKGENDAAAVPAKEPQRKRSDVSEIASVSVRELVRAMGGQEPRSNGNGTPQSDRGSSPMQIPGGGKTIDPAKVDSLSMFGAMLQDANHAVKNFRDTEAGGSQEFDVTTMRVTNFTPSQTAALLSTPKHSPRRMPLIGRHAPPPTFAEAVGLPDTELGNLEEEMGLLRLSSKTNGGGLPGQESGPHIWPTAGNGVTTFSQSTSKPLPAKKSGPIGPIKRAMPPSLAESIRAVFAAFLWHEGIVHDAMACASFLKFHPSLPKEGATVVTRRDAGNAKLHLSREQKAQQRHSVEVANAGSYLNIRPSTLETLTKCGNSSVNNRKYRKNLTSESSEKSEKSEQQKLHALPEIVTVLPPALRCLVFLWEQVCTNCIQIVQTNAFERQKLSTPTRDTTVDTKEKCDNNDKEVKKGRKKKKDDGSWCEICEVFLPIPVTYHMRIVHPGCGKTAKGKGYNSVGIFCEGWAGNCGEGGKGASSWFLMCDACRDKYMASSKNTNNVNATPTVTHAANDMNLFGLKTTTLIANSEIYTTMRENATFLLELSSNVPNLPNGPAAPGAPTNILLSAGTKRSPQQMPVVIENQHFNMPSTSRGDCARNSRIGLRMSGRFGSSTPFRKSFGGAAPPSPDNVWLAPESFACMESLGVATNEDLPYEIFGLNANESGFDRPLSEISYESCEPNNYEIMAGSTATQTGVAAGGAAMSKFHRSFSMGQGWGAAQQQLNFNIKGCPPNADENQSKVVFRRRNNSTSEGDGSLLICYPSENLRKLVPETILNTSVVHPAVQRVTAMEAVFDASKCQNANSQQAQQSQLPEAKVQEPQEAAKEFIRGDKENATSPADDEPPPIQNAVLHRPSMSFITQKHDLEKLRYAMKRSLRIATCRIYSLQALNWLIRSVTQSICLHDLMWWFVSSLSISSMEMIEGKLEDGEAALEHPVSYTQISGRFSQMITQSLHIFLQSVADLTLYLPLGSPLQRCAIQCFGIRFRQADHQFLHSSHVFGNISKILSKSDEQNDAMAVSSGDVLSGGRDIEHNFQGVTSIVSASNAGAKIVYYADLNGMFEVTVSSRQAMAESLTDNSTETFWESDEEDRNKCKVIEISMNKFSYSCKVVLVHIDNSRDIQNKVLSVVFYAGASLGDTSLIKSVDVDQKACAWISAKVTDENYTHFRLELHGPENTLRIRQIKLLGLPSAMGGFDDQLSEHFCGISVQALKSNLKFSNATRIQQQICEAETLRVFRLITGQVFGKLISTATSENNKLNDSRHQSALGMDSSTNSMLADSLDLREHMVGILFSRSKLSHLQKQVIVHIVNAIKKEAQRAKEDWEIVNLTNCFKEAQGTTTSATSAGDPKSENSSERYRAPDTYCFEMLSMVLALSGSVVGRSYLSHQYGLLKDLLSLLHTGSDRVQRQVTALLRRILPEISPESFAELLCVQRLPPSDYNIAHQQGADFDMNRLGLLDIFLAVIAKSLQLQVKVKTTSSKLNVEKTPSFIRLCNSLDLSVHLLRQCQKPLDEAIVGNEDDFSRCHPFQFENNKVRPEYSTDFGILGRSTLKAAKKDSKKNLNQRWFLNGVISTKQAESIISLIRDLASGKLSEKWSQITKAAIAESVLNLTRLEEVFRHPENCIKTATLWLALASLCVLDRDHVEKLSSGQWSKVSDTRPMCNNHDDGETAAIIQCETCGSLCGDCDRYLHLNRKTRMHKRTVCKEEEEAIRVELHESCGRTKLFWLLALADSKTLKAMVEFRDGNHTIISGPQETVGRCRFCGITGNSGLLEIGNVCADAQCQEYAANSCMKTKPCGHACGGVANEKKCLPCLQHMCHVRENDMAEEQHEPKLTQDADDMCMICFVEALSCAPSIHLDCGHVFHYHCCKAVLEKRWSGPRITFGFSLCPICKADIQHALLGTILEPINSLKQDVKRKALMRLKYEGIVKETDSKDVTNLAMDRYAYYVCFKCQKAYYGGEARCDVEIGEKFDPEELVCGGCSDVARAQMCPKHGTDFLEYKCRYCCSVAVFFCFGTTHFCDTCHDDFQRLTNIPKLKLPQCPAGPKAKQLMGDECPLHVIHPPTGEEFALGCGVCRNAQTF